MTLKNRFESVLVFSLTREIHNKECEKIAEDFAIDFGNWIKNSSIKNSDLPITVLLKMFKNQKGL